MFDVISGGADLMNELTADAKEPLKQTGTETVNGVPAKVFEENGSGGKGKVWLAVNGGYPVKVASVGPDGKEETLIEVKNLSFAKPPPSKLFRRTGCVAVQGVSTATGGHAEVGGSDSKPTANVTAATLAPIANYKGARAPRISR